MRTFTLLLLSAPLLGHLAIAQTGIPVAGFGNGTPGDLVTAAPGQLLVVSVYGVTARIPAPIFPIATENGLPTTVNGVSVDFKQGPLSVQLAIRALQQTPCPVAAGCSPATSITVQIPLEFNPDSSTRGGLLVKEAGKVVATVQLNGVTDSVHILNTCDQTGISLSLAYGTPPALCVPMVMHPRSPLVSSSAPATAGETLVVWAYGLGAPSHPLSESCCASPDELPTTAQPINVTLSYTDLSRLPAATARTHARELCRDGRTRFVPGTIRPSAAPGGPGKMCRRKGKRPRPSQRADVVRFRIALRRAVDAVRIALSPSHRACVRAI